MARKTSKRNKAGTAAKESAARPTTSKQSRREVLVNMTLYSVGAVALLGGGGALAMDFRRKLAEGDLDRIGNGTPSVVQIHDPNCALCTTLQKAARRAFKLCDDNNAQYLVANVRSTCGATFQASMGLPHVTLVFFDGTGRHVHTIQGVTPAETIKADITSYLG